MVVGNVLQPCFGVGAVAGQGNANLGTALLLLPAFSIAMVLVNLALRPMLARK